MSVRLSDLLQRRVPHIVGFYLLASWGVVEFVDWAVEQYVLSPHLTNFAVALLLLMLPTVVLLAYGHGEPGPNRATWREKVGIPANLLLAIGVLATVFSGKTLGAATETLVLEDPEGNQIERAVPKGEFRKKVALFYFDNESGDTSLDWLSYGIPMALEVDLEQDMFISVSTPLDEEFLGSDMLQELQEAGFGAGVPAPLPLLREIAGRRHLDYFVSGSINAGEVGLFLESELYETRRAKLLARQTFSGDDVFELIDRMSLQLKRDLNVPDYRIEESTDFPISELLTASLPAFAEAAMAVHASAGGDVETASRLLASAVLKDPTFAFAQAELGWSYLTLNQRPEADSAMQAAMRHLYRLPERTQLETRSFYQAFFEEDADKAFKTVKYWVELYPEDIEGHEWLANEYRNRRQYQEAVAEFEAVLAMDPARFATLQMLGWTYGEMGELQRALEAFQRYAERYPNDYRSHKSIAGVYSELGEHEQAQAAAERALVIEPEEVSVLLLLGQLATDLGDFDQASRYRQQALAVSKSPQDRHAVFTFDETLHYRQGQFEKLTRDYQLRRAEAEQYLDPLSLSFDVLESEALLFAAEAGRESFALRELDKISAAIASPLDGLMAYTYLMIHLQLEDTANARRQIDRLNSVIEAFGFEVFGAVVDYGVGRIAEIEGDCEGAIPSYQEAEAILPELAAIAIGRCQRKSGEHAAAERTLTDRLRLVPADPKAHFELALVYEQMGRHADAIAQLEAALVIWKNADPEYKPAQRAREKLAELTGR